MKKIIITLIATLPMLAFAGTGGDKEKHIDVKVTVSKQGKVTIHQNDKDFEELEQKLNNLLENVTVEIDGNRKKHEIHLKADLKTE